MKTATKWLVGIGVVAVVSGGIVGAKALKKEILYYQKKRRMKDFVHDKLGGNEKLLSAVDELSEKDLDHFIKVMDRLKQSKERISVYGKNVKETTEELKERFNNFLEEMI